MVTPSCFSAYPNPERLFFKQRQTEALFDTYENLDYRACMMVADPLGFCPECCGIYELGTDEYARPIKLLRKSKAYIDFAAEHALSSPGTAFRTVNGAYAKMRRELAEKGIYYPNIEKKNVLWYVFIKADCKQICCRLFSL